MIGRADRAWNPTARSRLPYIAAGCVAGASLWISLYDRRRAEDDYSRRRSTRSPAPTRRSR